MKIVLDIRRGISYDTHMKNTTVTTQQYGAFQQAYDFFNKKLFNNELPNVLITMNRHAKSLGYFAPEKFGARQDEGTVHELSMNPDHFGRTDEAILSTLAHEMAHVWQQEFGKKPRGGYHDKQWGAKMKEIGLHPSDTGCPGGKETGQRMTHYIVEDGLYKQAFNELMSKGFELKWGSQTAQINAAAGKASVRAKKAASKTKYTCPDCGTNAWAKPDTKLQCGECILEMEVR